MYITYQMSQIWVLEAFFNKWVIAYYSRMEQNFEIPNPAHDAKFYEEFNYDKYKWDLFATDEVIYSHFFSILFFKFELSRDLA